MTPLVSRSHRELPIARGLRSAATSIRWIAIVLLILFSASGLTVIEPGEVALVLRFGKLHGATPVDRVKQSGLLFALPFPMDEVFRIPIRQEGELLIDDVWKTLSGSDDTGGTINPLREGYVLTGDQNLVQAKLLVKYRISDPVSFVLQHRSDTRLLRDTVIASLSRTISGWNVDSTLRQQAIVEGVNESLSSVTMRRAQLALDEIEYGLSLSAIEFQELHPPRHVVAEFQRVQSEKIAIETSVRGAEGFAAREIPRAESERNRLVAEATTAANAIMTNANAEVSVFTELLTQCKQHPIFLRQRLYSETLEEVLLSAGRVQYVAPHTRLLFPAPSPAPFMEAKAP